MALFALDNDLPYFFSFSILQLGVFQPFSSPAFILPPLSKTPYGVHGYLFVFCTHFLRFRGQYNEFMVKHETTWGEVAVASGASTHGE
jgi:hypothetical protein